MSAAAVLARAEAAGVRLRLTAGGTVEVEADAPPPAALLDELRQWRDQIADLLAERDIPSEPGASDPGVVWNDHEREAMVAHYSAPASDRPYRPTDPDPYRDGLRVAALMRPPSWSGSTPPPPKGAWCSCCGRSNPKAGGRWWQPRHPRKDGTGLGQGWRCWRCHPPPDPSEVEERRT
jgi:hypothetical protein